MSGNPSENTGDPSGHNAPPGVKKPPQWLIDVNWMTNHLAVEERDREWEKQKEAEEKRRKDGMEAERQEREREQKRDAKWRRRKAEKEAERQDQERKEKKEAEEKRRNEEKEAGASIEREEDK